MFVRPVRPALDGPRTRASRRGLLPSLVVSLVVHAGALLAFAAGAFPPRHASEALPLVLELSSLPTVDEVPAAAEPPALEPPSEPPAPDVASNETPLAEAPSPAEPSLDDARWLFEVLADARERGAPEHAPRRPPPPAEAVPEPSSQAPVARASEWQGPPAPETAPQAAVLAPVPLADNAPPQYPAAARRAGEEGLVLVRARVLADGSVAEVELAQSSGHAQLDDAALSAVAGWRFQPALRDGRAVAQGIELPIRFRLRDR
jgi:protein TonB